jgi:hypothetical protein
MYSGQLRRCAPPSDVHSPIPTPNPRSAVLSRNRPSLPSQAPQAGRPSGGSSLIGLTVRSQYGRSTPGKPARIRAATPGHGWSVGSPRIIVSRISSRRKHALHIERLININHFATATAEFYRVVPELQQDLLIFRYLRQHSGAASNEWPAQFDWSTIFVRYDDVAWKTAQS